VRLAGGEYSREQLRIGDPLGVARMWERLGFRQLHIVDLDAAFGVGANEQVIGDVLDASRLEVQVGGGVRTEDHIERLLERGAQRVVVGTQALEDTDWLEDVASRFPHELIVAADVRDRRLVSRGWLRTLPADIIETVQELNALPLAGVLVTAVHRQGLQRGSGRGVGQLRHETSRRPLDSRRHRVRSDGSLPANIDASVIPVGCQGSFHAALVTLG